MKILLHGLNFSPEELGIGKYSGEMAQWLSENGCEVTVVTTPPYYPMWKVAAGYRRWWYSSETKNENLKVTRCPLWVPKKVSGLKRIIHLASFGLTSMPVVIWKAITTRPDLIMTVEPASSGLPATLLASRLCGAKSWLHIQDFEVDAAFELGILKQPILRKLVQAGESFLMRRFDRVSSISPNMVKRAQQKGVQPERCVLFPNWVDTEMIKPLENPRQYRKQFGIPEDKCIAMYAGNVGAKQGLGMIVEAAKLAAANGNDNLHFVISGTGAAYPALKEAAKDLSNVQLLPSQPNAVFNQFMNCADIHLLPQKPGVADLVMPSKLGGMMASGRPVVACAAQGTQIANVVEGRGLVVDPGSIQDFFDSIASLASDSVLQSQYGQAGRDHVVNSLGKQPLLLAFLKHCRAVALVEEAAELSTPGKELQIPVSLEHQLPTKPHLAKKLKPKPTSTERVGPQG